MISTLQGGCFHVQLSSFTPCVTTPFLATRSVHLRSISIPKETQSLVVTVRAEIRPLRTYFCDVFCFGQACRLLFPAMSLPVSLSKFGRVCGQVFGYVFPAAYGRFVPGLLSMHHRAPIGWIAVCRSAYEVWLVTGSRTFDRLIDLFIEPSVDCW